MWYHWNRYHQRERFFPHIHFILNFIKPCTWGSLYNDRKLSIVLFFSYRTNEYCVFVSRTANDIGVYLDQQRNRVRVSFDVFSNVIESHRARLCSYIEKLMFSAPLEYGRRCEELLWRKCFYDVYTTLKRLKKVKGQSLSFVFLHPATLYEKINVIALRLFTAGHLERWWNRLVNEFTLFRHRFLPAFDNAFARRVPAKFRWGCWIPDVQMQLRSIVSRLWYD